MTRPDLFGPDLFGLFADLFGSDLWQAHGIGGQKDLPISLGLAVAGAIAALVISFTVLSVAWRQPRYDAATSGRPAPLVAAAGRRVDAVPRRAARARHGRLPLHRVRGGVRPRLHDQPVLRHLLHLALGRHRADVVAVRPVLEGDQPGPHDQLGVREDRGQRPRRGSLPLPRAARLLAGCPRSLRLRVVRAGLPLHERAGPGSLLVRHLRRRDADGRCTVRQHVLRARRPVRGLLDPRGQALRVGDARRRPARAQPARQSRLGRRSVRGWSASSASCSAAPGTTPSASRRCS